MNNIVANNIVANNIVANTLNISTINGVNFNMEDGVNYDFNSCNYLNSEGMSGVGFTGPQGIQGLTGSQGIKGDTGALGPQGVTGPASTSTFAIANNNMIPYNVLRVSGSTTLSFPLQQIIVVQNTTTSININLPLINSSHEGLIFQFISYNNNNTVTITCNPINQLIQLSNMNTFSKMTIPSTNALLYCILLIPNSSNYAWYQVANTAS